MAYSIAVHVVGLVMWLGGMMIITRCVKLFSADPVQAKAAQAPLRRLYAGFVIPGVVLMAGSGLYQLSSGGFGHYFSQSWFHAKLGLVVVLLVLTALLPKVIGRLGSDPTSAGKRAMMFHGISALVLIVVVFLTIPNVR